MNRRISAKSRLKGICSSSYDLDKVNKKSKRRNITELEEVPSSFSSI